MEPQTITLLGITLILLGFLLAFAGTLMSSLHQTNPGPNVRSGGVIFLGPIPIIFGTDKGAATWAAAIAMLMLAAYFILHSR
ncbi:Uncharacterised protein [uncultured archaeon]|nr:Uncharacterised protein [uncultured archaeon]